MTGQERSELIELFTANRLLCTQLADLVGVSPEDEWLIDEYMDGNMMHKADRMAVERYMVKAASILRDEE